MNIPEDARELYTADLDSHAHSSAYKLLRTGTSLATIGVVSVLAGSAAEVSGIKEGIGLMIAGIAVDYLGAISLVGAVIVGANSGEKNQPNEP